MGSNIGKNMSKNLISKCSPKPLDHAKKNQLQMRKLIQNEQFKKQQKQLVIWLLKEVANRITKVSNNSQQNNPETITNENDKEIPEERYISPEERQNIIDNLRLIE